MKISASPQVENWLLALSPEPKRRVRAELKLLAQEKSKEVKVLHGELEGWHRLRIRGYRILFQIQPSQIIFLEYANTREVVYETFLRLRALKEL